MITGDSEQFIWAMWDSSKAALVGLNLVPVVIVSLFVGMVLSTRASIWLKVILSVIPAIVIASLWPMASGYQPIWPDLTELECQIQIGMVCFVSLAVLLVVGLVKSALSLSPSRSRRTV